MAATRVSLLVFVVAIWAVEYADCASPHAPAPAVDCSSLILNMADCLSFVSNGSSVSKPEGTCCSGLKTVLKADAACLCEAFRSSAQLGVVLNVTKAMTLPSACKVSAPAATNCKLTDAPAAAPAVAVSPESSSPATAAAPSSTVEAPAPSPGSSGAGASFRSVSGGSIIAIGLAVAVSLF